MLPCYFGKLSQYVDIFTLNAPFKLITDHYLLVDKFDLISSQYNHGM